jgi:hypothetical protein
VSLMTICEVCGEEEDIVTKCKTCGTQFCEFCGSVDDKTCIACLDNIYEDDDDKDDDMR